MIHFLFDITRPPFESWGTHIRYARQICGFFEWQIQKVSCNTLKLLKTNLEEENGFDRKKFYSLMNIKFDKENWTKIYDTQPTQEAIQYIEEFIDRKNLVLSYEASPTILRILNILEINYIDIRVCSIKYLDDLVLGFRTNNEKIFSQILRYKVSEDQFWFEASLLKSRIRLVNQDIHNKLEKNSALFLGQMSGDASLIKNGKFLTPLDFKKQFLEKIDRYNCVYFKKHPFDRDFNLSDHFRNVKEIKTNIYHLMCSDNIEDFFSISSGAIQEAQYFGKNINYFSEPIYKFIKDDETTFSKDNYISVYRQFFEPNFWADILNPVTNTEKLNNVELLPVQSRLRYLHNIYWGYDSLIKDRNVFFKEDSVNSIKELNKKIYKLDNKRFGRKLARLIKNIKKFYLKICHKITLVE